MAAHAREVRLGEDVDQTVLPQGLDQQFEIPRREDTEGRVGGGEPAGSRRRQSSLSQQRSQTDCTTRDLRPDNGPRLWIAPEEIRPDFP